ncbi:STM4504/CBY_0614 family protein [Vreelandella alkaliphila]|uniref:STM4504/CBY_0614 family protein n=1 Tax=Vreelandella alkaliphila TaxID=272774 RepID=UPI003FD6CDDD
MAIFDLFSKRQKALRGDVPDVYIYDNLPNALRVQIVHIWTDALGSDRNYYNHYGCGANVQAAYKFIVDTLCREYGMFQLPTAEKHRERMYLNELANYLLQVDNIEKQLDVVELSFRYIDRLTREYDYLRKNNASESVDEAISELNARFKEHGIGFQFVEGEIVRVDSELLHCEAVKPVLRLLNEKNYQGAQQEFLSAYEHYRHGKNKEALNDCLKSFESTMKAICDKRNWPYQQNATSKALIQVCFDNDLVPLFWQQQLSSLRSMLESSIPTGRNKLSGHGQGVSPTTVPDYLVAYMLHMTASTLVFLTTAEKNIA